MPTKFDNKNRQSMLRNASVKENFSSMTTVGPRSAAVLQYLGSTKSGRATIAEIVEFFDSNDNNIRDAIHRLRSRGLVSFAPISRGNVNTQARVLEAGRQLLTAAMHSSVVDGAGLVLTGARAPRP